ncbi:MAG: Smr/MutS family protein [Bacteroidales bacterium]|jgi:DNA mismatch repair protein MutS2|nr:Smr/MutS family protein [Bacteroidales bacterium]
MDIRLENKLGFTQIREIIKENCLSKGGEELVERMHFSSNFYSINNSLNLTEEFREILVRNSLFPNDNYYDMREELERLKLSGTFIGQRDLNDLKGSLITINECLKFFSQSEEENYTNLKKLSQDIYIEKEIIKYTFRLLDDKGEFLDNASDYLSIIRSNKRKKIFEVDKRIQKILSQSKKEGWTSEEAEITLRNGRSVIPVSSTNKRKLKGFVHDESSTGQTSYIEPEEIVELNNQVRELEIEERREIIKILTEFTVFLRPYIEDLIKAYNYLAKVDFIRAKAKFALSILAGKPLLEDTQRINWFDARHPLLQISLKKNNRDIIPLRVELNRDNRILIISGPNAGGKSVCLKTVGLLQYMLQSGLLIPIRETSEVGIFKSIFIDIGDEQSLENDLSTYSSHLLNMKNLCTKADNKTLFLIDEFGTGTDPSIGGAIAESILEFLNKKQAFGIVTTHYSNLKLLAQREDNIINGAMLFDQKNMRPLYKLSIGMPGSSFAFEIAQTIGLPESIIDSATDKIGLSHFEFEQELQNLEYEKGEIKKKSQELKIADELLSGVIEKYNNLSQSLENEKREILKQAKREAKEIIINANKKIENTISQIKESNADKIKTQKLRDELKSDLIDIEKDIHKVEKHKQNKPKDIGVKLDLSPIQIGDIVRIGEDNIFAEVVRINRNKIEVISDSIKMSIDKNKVIKVDKKNYLKQSANKKSKSIINSSIFEDINEKRKEFSLQLDIRGLRAEKALEEVGKFIDEARLLGERDISILHGKGDGILKTIIRDFLKTNSEVESYKSARIELGGEGITQVKLN